MDVDLVQLLEDLLAVVENGDLLVLHAQERVRKGHVVRAASLEGEFAVGTRHGAAARLFEHDAHAGQRQSVFVVDHAGELHGLLGALFDLVRRPDDDHVAADLVAEAAVAQTVFHHVNDGGAAHLHRNARQRLDLRIVVDEVVLRVVVQPGKDLLYGGVAEVDRDRLLRLLCADGAQSRCPDHQQHGQPPHHSAGETCFG